MGGLRAAGKFLGKGGMGAMKSGVKTMKAGGKGSLLGGAKQVGKGLLKTRGFAPAAAGAAGLGAGAALSGD